MNVAIMQPCYLPWRGYFALMTLCDTFVHLDDVALPNGRSPQTRVAVKTAQGRRWLTVPVTRGRGRTIRHVEVAHDRWRRKHATTLRQELPASAPLVEDLYGRPWTRLADLSIELVERLASALGIRRTTLRSGELAVPGHASEKILDLCRELGATRYVTGHGARRYLDHARFDEHGIEVLYVDYDLTAYRQPHGPFDPYVTVLDLLAHAPQPARLVGGRLVPWREFLTQPASPA